MRNANPQHVSYGPRPKAPPKSDHLPRFPKMEVKTPNSDPLEHWGRVRAHLLNHHPKDKAGLKKARKMQGRFE